jgi:hypothetical protein
MKKSRVFLWLLMAALAASLPITAQAAGGNGMRGGPHFSGGRGFAFHDGRFHNRFFVRNGFPYPYPYPYPYYWYPGPYWGY